MTASRDAANNRLAQAESLRAVDFVDFVADACLPCIRLDECVGIKLVLSAEHLH